MPSEVPRGRLQRIGKLSGLAAKLASSTVASAAGQLMKAQKPSLNTTFLTSENARSITAKLSQMRGAAMKVGQLLSMDAGEFLPAEWEPILAQLRQGADAMPKNQLLYMLNAHWGKDWMDKFSYFSFEPVASASIGQVHKAVLKSGETLAIKVQYPGVAESIDSDINNLGRLFKMTGLAPKELQLDNLLTEAKKQLRQEADYRQELAFLNQYSNNIAHDPRFIVPKPYPGLCNQFILSMEFVEGVPLDTLATDKTNTVDSVCQALMELTLGELFKTGFMQSDPNFSNYFYQHHSGKIVLLDFGACCQLSAPVIDAYESMAKAMQIQDSNAITEAFFELGLLRKSMPKEVIDIVVTATMSASECLQTEEYNFKQQGLVSRLYAETRGIMRNRNAVASPTFDSTLVNRKISGMILLANKLGATLPMRDTLSEFIPRN